MLLSVRLFVSERVISLCCKELLDDLDGEKEGVCSFDVTLCVSVRVCVCEGMNRPVCVSMHACVCVCVCSRIFSGRVSSSCSTSTII